VPGGLWSSGGAHLPVSPDVDPSVRRWHRDLMPLSSTSPPPCHHTSRPQGPLRLWAPLPWYLLGWIHLLRSFARINHPHPCSCRCCSTTSTPFSLLKASLGDTSLLVWLSSSSRIVSVTTKEEWKEQDVRVLSCVLYRAASTTVPHIIFKKKSISFSNVSRPWILPRVENYENYLPALVERDIVSFFKKIHL
jgi:hypothetical protein